MTPRVLRFSPVALAAALLGLVACGGSHGGGGGSSSPSSHGGGDPVTEPPAKPKGMMSREDAGHYVLDLVNYDRGKQGLPPVGWDDTAAKAGTRQAEDMARHGYTGHIGTDGSVPEQRYSEAGGEHMVMENAGCLADGEPRELDADPKFAAEWLEKIEHAFMDEVPPNDGHRRNILMGWHTSIGVGLAKPKGLPIACMTHEFLDDYGDYDDLPKTRKVGAKIKVAGLIGSPATFAGVGIARVDAPTPKKPKDIMKSHSYQIPKPYETYFPRGFKTPIPVDFDGKHFSIELPLSQGGRSGMYEISVWAKVPRTDELVMVSLRTIAVN